MAIVLIADVVMNPGVTGQPGPAALPAYTTGRSLSSSTIAQLVGSSTAHAAARPGHDTAAIKTIFAQSRQREPGLAISVAFDGATLTVADDGSAIVPSLAKGLLREPVASDDGLGIGLYHAARQADALGYRLAVAESRPGRVAFALAPAI